MKICENGSAAAHSPAGSRRKGSSLIFNGLATNVGSSQISECGSRGGEANPRKRANRQAPRSQGTFPREWPEPRCPVIWKTSSRLHNPGRPPQRPPRLRVVFRAPRAAVSGFAVPASARFATSAARPPDGGTTNLPSSDTECELRPAK